MRVELTVYPGVPKSRVVVKDLPAIVGRNPHADVRISDSWVSRVHCELYDLEGALVVRDLGSRHGTLVDGVKIAEATLLPGDSLMLGMTRLEVAYERRPQNVLQESTSSACIQNGRCCPVS